jgi:hypothetical protein
VEYDVTSGVVQVAERFARLLDGRDYDALGELLLTDCEYELKGDVVRGRAAIVEEYRQSTEWAFDVFDRVEFSSIVNVESQTSARVTFFDELFLGSQTHRYMCQQILTAHDNGRIERILHVDLAGEEAALEAFFTKCGVKRPRK